MATARQIKILTVDDHPILREGIASIIQGEKDMVVVGEASNGREAIEVFRSKRPDVTLMDLQMPDVNGIAAIAAIRQEHPQARIIVLTTYEGDVLARRALKAGATGYILKDMIRTELLEAIRAVHLGRKYIPPKIAAELVDHYAEDDLSEREIEVLRERIEGGREVRTAFSITHPAHGPNGFVTAADDVGLPNLASSIGTFCRTCSSWIVELSPGRAIIQRNGVSTPSTIR